MVKDIKALEEIISIYAAELIEYEKLNLEERIKNTISKLTIARNALSEMQTV